MFRDEQGRARIFHGTNAVMKPYPYIPIQDHFDPHMSLSDKDLQDMQDWGITLLRLGVTWESVETSPGQYNMTYLDEIENLVNKLGNYGIYTMVDAHQDLFSRKTCGEGMPSFIA
jgi:endoglycosylceramidase